MLNINVPLLNCIREVVWREILKRISLEIGEKLEKTPKKPEI